MDRIKKKLVLQGLDLTLSSQPSQSEYDLKVDGRPEAQLLAMSCSAPPEGQARWSLRLLGGCPAGQRRIRRGDGKSARPARAP